MTVNSYYLPTNIIWWFITKMSIIIQSNSRNTTNSKYVKVRPYIIDVLSFSFWYYFDQKDQTRTEGLIFFSTIHGFYILNKVLLIVRCAHLKPFTLKYNFKCVDIEFLTLSVWDYIKILWSLVLYSKVFNFDFIKFNGYVTYTSFIFVLTRKSSYLRSV